MTTAHRFQPDFPTLSAKPPILKHLAAEASREFREHGFPAPRSEDWRLTSLKPVLDSSFTSGDAADFDFAPWALPDAVNLAWVNGRLSNPEALDTTHPGLTIDTLERAAERHPSLVEPHLGRLAAAQGRPFVALNTAQGGDGLLIHVAAGTNLDVPLNIMSATVGEGSVAYPRILVVAEDGAELTFIETLLGRGHSLTCPVTEVVIGAGSTARHLRITELESDDAAIGTVAATIEREGCYRLNTVSDGGSLSRTDLSVALNGPRAHAALDGVTLVGGREQGVTHVTVDHRVPDCTSMQRFRSVLDGRSKTVFTGKIIVAEDAQKTDAKQSSRSLLRSTDAVAHNNPQLEIYADDVRCTHGSTIGELDEEALFYLRARGIGRRKAEGLLTLAFVGEILNSIPVESLRSRLEDRVLDRLDDGKA